MNTPTTRRTALHRWAARQHLMIGVCCAYWGFRLRRLIQEQPLAAIALALLILWPPVWGAAILAGHHP